MFYGAKPTGNAGSTSADMQMLQDKAYDFQCGREGLLNFPTAQLNICPLSGLKKIRHERRELDPHFHEKVCLLAMHSARKFRKTNEGIWS